MIFSLLNRFKIIKKLDQTIHDTHLDYKKILVKF